MKRYLMEFVGTLFLTIAVSFAPAGNALAVGLMLMSMFYIGGHISGGHFNPAVSIGAWLQDALRTDDLFFYITAQTIGACVALWLFKMIMNGVFTPEVPPQVSLWMAVFMEALLTTVWVMVYLTVTGVGKFKSSVAAGVAVGFALMSIAFLGGLYNPAVAIGSGLMNVASGGAFPSTDAILIYLVGPVIGGVAASYAFSYFNPE